MDTATNKTYKSPRRKLVKFFERSRDKWKAKALEAKKVSKRLQNRVRFLERRKEAYTQQVKALEEQLIELQARQKQTERALEERKKNQLPANHADGF